MISNKQEFRLGNMVMDEVSGEWMEIFEIGENITAYVINRDKYPFTHKWQMAPIPLTPEIVEKLGFKKSGDQYYGPKQKDGSSLRIWTSSYQPEKFYFSLNMFNRINITSLHQFQNLYFAITGEELTMISSEQNVEEL